MIQELTLESLKEHIRNIPDYPKKGIQFKDITTLIKHPGLFSFIVRTIADYYRYKGITKVVGIESRGFILGGAIASEIGAGFVPVRKPGKLPAKTYKKQYSLEYGTDAVEIHTDALTASDVVLLHDDLLATGGTTRATIELLGNFKIRKIYLNYLCELDFLNGRQQLNEYDIFTLIHF